MPWHLPGDREGVTMGPRLCLFPMGDNKQQVVADPVKIDKNQAWARDILQTATAVSAKDETRETFESNN